MNMIPSITRLLKQAGLRDTFLEEMIDHYTSSFEQQCAQGIPREQAFSNISSAIEQQKLRPIQRKIFFIHHQNKLILMSLSFIILLFSFFTNTNTSDLPNSNNATALTINIQMDSLKFGKVVDGALDITANFGMHAHPLKKQRMMHKGLDIKGQIGDAVYAPLEGLVEKIGEDSTKGKYIEIIHANGFSTRYFHLSAILVKKNQTVTKGMTIGKIGTTGMSTGPHLHFEILIQEKQVNPEGYIRA